MLVLELFFFSLNLKCNTVILLKTCVSQFDCILCTTNYVLNRIATVLTMIEFSSARLRHKKTILIFTNMNKTLPKNYYKKYDFQLFFFLTQRK